MTHPASASTEPEHSQDCPKPHPTTHTAHNRSPSTKAQWQQRQPRPKRPPPRRQACVLRHTFCGVPLICGPDHKRSDNATYPCHNQQHGSEHFLEARSGFDRSYDPPARREHRPKHSKQSPAPRTTSNPSHNRSPRTKAQRQQGQPRPTTPGTRSPTTVPSERFELPSTTHYGDEFIKASKISRRRSKILLIVCRTLRLRITNTPF